MGRAWVGGRVALFGFVAALRFPPGAAEAGGQEIVAALVFIDFLVVPGADPFMPPAPGLLKTTSEAAGPFRGSGHFSRGRADAAARGGRDTGSVS